ncbi:hypothetical protein SAMN05216573_10195 [Bradyrhizobium sp. Rc3b]|uniref:hypothetical protein n=1 Tax=Bradyrhizobium sp. Rc3b TaxID=1855322 RepID=UPI0008E85A4D|nr:hypothetical protein [Bradyrhizobium sp. Rc3b]SFM34714.1 hypothetical protein SAMN05216573_10195 [Bradyrhizobium sp. Rc3b]
MRAVIKDAQAIGSLTPINVVGYLRSRGWQRFSEVPGKFSVWFHSAHPEAEILVPATRDARDYVTQISEALQELETVENRSQLDILKDLRNSGFDVIRLAARGASTQDGTVRIDAGVRLFEQARELLLSAACATVRPRPVFHSRKPQPALEYMSKARLGQTEHGSYVLTVLSPVSPQLTFHSDTDLFPEEPFERSVVKMLTGAVERAMNAAAASSISEEQDFGPFQRAVDGGVSANLCEAIAGFFGPIDASAIDLTVAWSLNRPLPADSVPARVRINSDFVPTLQEAARLFRQYDRLGGYLIEGPVVKLERDDGDDFGFVTVFARVEGTMRKVTVALPDADYNRALMAHRAYRPVKVTGTVVREGRSYRLYNPTALEIAHDDEDPAEEA